MNQSITVQFSSKLIKSQAFKMLLLKGTKDDTTDTSIMSYTFLNLDYFDLENIFTSPQLTVVSCTYTNIDRPNLEKILTV